MSRALMKWKETEQILASGVIAAAANGLSDAVDLDPRGDNTAIVQAKVTYLNAPDGDAKLCILLSGDDGVTYDSITVPFKSADVTRANSVTVTASVQVSLVGKFKAAILNQNTVQNITAEINMVTGRWEE